MAYSSFELQFVLNFWILISNYFCDRNCFSLRGRWVVRVYLIYEFNLIENSVMDDIFSCGSPNNEDVSDGAYVKFSGSITNNFFYLQAPIQIFGFDIYS